MEFLEKHLRKMENLDFTREENCQKGKSAKEIKCALQDRGKDGILIIPVIILKLEDQCNQ